MSSFAELMIDVVAATEAGDHFAECMAVACRPVTGLSQSRIDVQSSAVTNHAKIEADIVTANASMSPGVSREYR